MTSLTYQLGQTTLGNLTYSYDLAGQRTTVGGSAKAISDYVRTLTSGNSPRDRWRRNHDESAVSDHAERGHEVVTPATSMSVLFRA